jgi:hypothetical protein
MRWSRQKGGIRPGGVTLVELLIAMLSASILALTAGIILVFCFKTLRANGDVVGLQRDVDITTRTLYRAIRTARSSELNRAHLPVNGTSSRLTIGTRSFFRATAAHTFDAGGSFLVYDPNTAAGGDEQVLVAGTLQSCTFTDNHNAIGISFTVAAEYDTISVDTDIHMRNEL